jgi:hypothetical protein
VCLREFIVFFVFIVFFALSLSPSVGFWVNRKIGPHTGSYTSSCSAWMLLVDLVRPYFASVFSTQQRKKKIN